MSNVSKNTAAAELQSIEDCKKALMSAKTNEDKSLILNRLTDLLSVKEAALKVAQTSHSRSASESSYAYKAAVYLTQHSLAATSADFVKYCKEADAAVSDRATAQAFSQVKSAFCALVVLDVLKESALAAITAKQQQSKK